MKFFYKFNSEDLILYHSQFTYKDRKEIEQKIINSKEKRPLILIATQVIEISLDISSDCIITELAPIDALAQRGGRLHRGSVTPIDKNGFKYVMHIYLPEEFNAGSFLGKRPYEPEILLKTKQILTSKCISYLDLKEMCDEVYRDRKIGYSPLCEIFKQNTLFGDRPKDLFREDEQGKGFKIRDISFQRTEVVPEIYLSKLSYPIENYFVKIPVWILKKDYHKETGDIRHFYLKEISLKNKIYNIRVCKLSYSKELGMDTRDIK